MWCEEITIWMPLKSRAAKTPTSVSWLNMRFWKSSLVSLRSLSVTILGVSHLFRSSRMGLSERSTPAGLSINNNNDKTQSNSGAIKYLCYWRLLNGDFSKQLRPRWNAPWCGISSWSTLFSTTKTIFREEIQFYLEIITYDFSIYTLDQPNVFL